MINNVKHVANKNYALLVLKIKIELQLRIKTNCALALTDIINNKIIYALKIIIALKIMLLKIMPQMILS